MIHSSQKKTGSRFRLKKSKFLYESERAKFYRLRALLNQIILIDFMPNLCLLLSVTFCVYDEFYFCIAIAPMPQKATIVSLTFSINEK